LRFIRTYWGGKTLHQSLGKSPNFWRGIQSLRNHLFWWRVESWARNLYRAEVRRGPESQLGNAVQAAKPHAPH
jgi:hypothetical protein